MKKFKQIKPKYLESDNNLENPVNYAYGQSALENNPQSFPMIKKSNITILGININNSNDLKKAIIAVSNVEERIKKHVKQDPSWKQTAEYEIKMIDLRRNKEKILQAKQYLKNIQKQEIGTISSMGTSTPTFNLGESRKIKKEIDEFVNKADNINEIAEEAKPQKPISSLQRKVLGKIESWEKKELIRDINDVVKQIEINLENEQKIDHFIKGYERLALLSKMMKDDEVDNLFNLSAEINIIKGYKPYSEEKPESRLDRVLEIDSTAHLLHSVKFQDGSSLYTRLDELADISKTMGEINRDSRLLILDNPAENKIKLEDLSKMEILYKGKMLEKSLSLWSIFEKAIKSGIKKLTNDECVMLREWLFSRI